MIAKEHKIPHTVLTSVFLSFRAFWIWKVQVLWIPVLYQKMLITSFFLLKNLKCWFFVLIPKPSPSQNKTVRYSIHKVITYPAWECDPVNTKIILVSNWPDIQPWQHGCCTSTNDPDSEEDDEEGCCEHHLSSVGFCVPDGQCKCHRSPEAYSDQKEDLSVKRTLCRFIP